MSRFAGPLVILAALVALAGCGSGGGDTAKTTSTTTTAAAPTLPKLSAAESRNSAGALLDSWSAEIIKAGTQLNAREQASYKGLRDPYYKADGLLRASIAKIDRFPAEAQRETARYVPASLVTALQADADAWKVWGDGIADVRAAAEQGRTPDSLSQSSLIAHLAAYKAARRLAPLNFRQAAKLLPKNTDNPGLLLR